MDVRSVVWILRMLAIAQWGPYVYSAANPLRRHHIPKTAYPSCRNHDTEKSSFLWEIVRSAPGSLSSASAAYFFGTIHVPYTKVWDYIPEAAKMAFKEADHVVFELDLTDRSTIVALSRCQMLPKGQNLSGVLPGDLYARLESHLEYIELMMPVWMNSDQRGRELYAGYLFNVMTNNWRNKRPVWAMLMLNSLTENDIKSRGAPVLDMYLAQEAVRAQKHIGAVERVEEQCQPLNTMNLTQVIFALDQSLRQHESIRAEQSTSPAASSSSDLVNHYRCGDLDSVIYGRDSTQMDSAGWNLANSKKGQEIDDYFRTELLQKRNRRMAKRVIELLETYPKRKFFFAFGAGHFLGNNSVIAYMKEMGYNISHLSTNHQIKSTSTALPSRSKNRRKNRQHSRVSLTATPWDILGKSGQLSRGSSQRRMDNFRSDYVDRRAYDRQEKRRPTSNGLSSREETTSEATSRFNDLWIPASTISPRYLSTTLGIHGHKQNRLSPNSGAQKMSKVSFTITYTIVLGMTVLLKRISSY